jgi:hypothetical protein
MADLILAVVLMLGGASAAELVRSSCKRRLTMPLTARRTATAADTGLQLPR